LTGEEGGFWIGDSRLSDTAPDLDVVRRRVVPRDPLTYPTHHTRAAQLADRMVRGAKGPPRPTKRGRI
jgi:hypothetical protein